MKRTLIIALALLMVAALVMAAAVPKPKLPKTYQVTGPVLELGDGLVTVQKGDEKWQLALPKDAKVTGDLKVGAKVTIEYRMTAATVEVKP